MATNTVPTFTNHTGNGTAGPFNIGFNFIDRNEVIVRVNEVLKSTPTHYTFNSGTQITFTSGNEPATGVNIELRRSTNITTAKVDFEDGSVLTETDLDANTNQLLFALQENTDAVNANNLESSSIYLRDGSRTLTGNIVFEGSTKDAHETTLTPVDPTADRTINIPNVSGTLVTTGDTGTVTSTMIANGTIVNADIDSSAAISGTKISPIFGSQNISTTGNVTATNFIGNGSQLTGITFTGIDQFLRKDIDVDNKTAVRDQCLGVIQFGSNITFKKSLEIPNTGDETSMNKILFEGTHADNYMEWTPTSTTFGRSLTFGDSVNIGAEGYWTLQKGSTGTYALRFQQSKGRFTFTTAAMNGNPTTTGTVGNSAIYHNQFKIQGHYNTNIPTSGSNQGSLSNELLADWLVLETDPLSFADMRAAGFANQVMLLRSNDNTILKVHKDGVDCLKGDIRVTTDTGKLQLGASQDLQIFHDGNNSVISDSGTGELQFKRGSDTILALSFNGIKVTDPDGQSAVIIEAFENSSARVELIADQGDDNGDKWRLVSIASSNNFSLQNDINGSNVAKWTINTSGDVTQAGNLQVPKEIKITAESVNDFESGRVRFIEDEANLNGGYIHYDGSANILKLGVHPSDDTTVGNDVDCIEIDRDTKNVELNFNGSRKFQTTSTGTTTTGVATAGGIGTVGFKVPDSPGVTNETTTHGMFIAGTGDDLRISHSGTDSFITNVTGNLHIQPKASEEGIKLIPDGAVQLYYDHVKRVETKNYGAQIHGALVATSDIKVNSYVGKLIVGTSNEFTIQHDDTDTFIENTTGNLHIRPKASEEGIKLIPDGAVEIYHNNVKKAETSASGLDLPDNSKLQLGDSNDLTLHHDGAGSKIENSTGSLNINTVSSEIWFSKGTSEYLARFITDGAVELYFDGSKKFETTSTGVKCSGDFSFCGSSDNEHIRFDAGSDHLKFEDNIKAKFGTNSDLQIFHDGNNSIIRDSGAGNLLIEATSQGEIAIKVQSNGTVELYNDNSKKFETTANGWKSGDNVKGTFGAGDDLQIYHDGTDSFIENSTGGLKILGDTIRLKGKSADENMIVATVNGAAELYHDGTKQFETTSQGAQIERAGTTKFALTNTNTSGTGHVNLALRSFSADSDTKILFGTSADDNPGEIKYVSDTNKFAWRVNGTNTYQISDSSFNPTSDNSVSLGTSLKRFTTLHSVALNTGDINMNNLNHASGNEVDNTKGSWSLQEGADDLFIINRVSGKKYKFNLTEIN